MTLGSGLNQMIAGQTSAEENPVIGAGRPTFEASYTPLSSDCDLNWGRVAVLPWDTEIFGFPVGQYVIGDLRAVTTAQQECRRLLAGWAQCNSVELVSCCVPGDDPLGLGILSRLGFTMMDFRLRVTLPRLQSVHLPPCRLTIRPAEPADLAPIERIAGAAFSSGRYHNDAWFPRQLANRRYRMWIHHALSSPGPSTRIYVAGPTGRVSGFFHVEVRGDEGDLRLGAVDVSLESGIAGFSLYAGTVGALKSEGVRRVTALVSAANTAVMNLYAALGFRFSQPEAVCHWHAASAPHLIALGKVSLPVREE